MKRRPYIRKPIVPGERAGHLLILERDCSCNKHGTWAWCLCDCGVVRSLAMRHIRAGKIRSCGCGIAMIKPIPKGSRYGFLTVLAQDFDKKGNVGQAYWICRCDCGKLVTAKGTFLRNGSNRSCGCGGIYAIGKRRNHLVFQGFIDNDEYLVACDCGNLVTLTRQQAKTKKTCGHCQSLLYREGQLRQRRFRCFDNLTGTVYHLSVMRKDRQILSDSYVRSQIAKRSLLHYRDIPNELVELKRAQLTLMRAIKEK